MNRFLALTSLVGMAAVAILAVLIGVTSDASWFWVAGVSGLGVVAIGEAEFGS